jgi:hypothetical protein
MTIAAGRTVHVHTLLPDAQEGADLALDAARDLASSAWADEDQMFHGRLSRTTWITYAVATTLMQWKRHVIARAR